MSNVDLKYVIIGPAGSGKTALFNHIKENIFSSQYDATIGAAYVEKPISLKNNISPNLGIWDTAGQERYESMSRIYLRNSHVIFITVDLTKTPQENKDYLNSLSKKYEEIFDPTIIKVLVGTKSDAKNADWDNNKLVMDEFAEANIQNNFTVFKDSTSAKEGLNVDELFASSTQLFIDKNPLWVQEYNDKIVRNNPQPLKLKLKPAPSSIYHRNEKIRYENFYNRLAALEDINKAFETTKPYLNVAWLTDYNPQLKAVHDSVITMRDKLVDIYLRHLPKDIIETINSGNGLDDTQQAKLDKINKSNVSDIKEVALHVNNVATFTRNNLGKYSNTNEIPDEIRNAAVAMREVFGANKTTALKIGAAFLITALCAIAGAAIGFGIGSVPAATLGVLLGIKISTTMLGLGTAAGAIGCGGSVFGFFRHGIDNRNAIEESISILETTAHQAAAGLSL